MNLTEIQELIKFVSRSGVTEVGIEQKDFKITIKSESKKVKREEQTIVLQQPVAQQAAPQVQAAPAPAAPAAPVALDGQSVRGPARSAGGGMPHRPGHRRWSGTTGGRRSAGAAGSPRQRQHRSGAAPAVAA